MFATTSLRAASRVLSARATATRSMATIAVGDKIPSIELHKGFPPKLVNMAEFCSNKKVILLGLPGAFTPTWSTKQIPHYKEHQDALRSAGIDAVVVWSVNDAAVMQAWAKDQKASVGLLQFMGDPSSALTKALDVELTHPGPQGKGLFGRCKRHAIYVDNGVVKAVRISEKEDDPAGDADPSATLADAMLKAIEEAK